METILQVTDLEKSYAGHPAVRGVSFRAGRGQTMALLGPNGAGKSTTIAILCTDLPADAGVVRLDGLTLGRQDREIRRRIGVVFQSGVLDDLLTVEENLRIRGRFYGLRGRELRERVSHVGEMTGTRELMGRPYGKLSGGQRRRCDIARALLHLPSLLILDEPTAGLDPEMRSAVWETVRGVQAGTGMTVLMTTHSMEEAAAADEIVILKGGRVIASGSPGELKARYSQDRLVLFPRPGGELRALLARSGVPCRERKDRVEVPLCETRSALPLLELCRGHCAGFEVLRGSMDDAYLAVMRGGGAHA